MTTLITRVSALAALIVFVLAPGANVAAQLAAAKDGQIVYGHHHLNVANVDEAKKFWIGALGGAPTKFGATEVVKVYNALIFLTPRKASGGSKGTSVDHIGFSVPNLRQVVDRVKAGGFRMVTAAEAPANITVKDDIGVVEGTGPVSGIAYAFSPDDVKVELVEMKAQSQPIASHHVHFFGAQKEMHAWYMQTFGAAAGTSANSAAFITATLPGAGLNFTPAQPAPAGTQGRALDHIGFEVKNLEAFTKKLEAQGVKFAIPYKAVPDRGIAIAFFTDPWGTYIELTEGLDKVN
jgi:catechol 2,3-dioxygenase-like lactoylglutathione lyase family enzyme